MTWAPGPCLKRARGGLVSIDKKAIEIKRMGASFSLHQTWPPHPTVRSEVEVGRSDGSVPAERTDARGSAPAAEDTVPATSDGKPQVADAEAWEWVSVRATRGFAALQGRHSVEMEVTPGGTRRRRAVGSTKSGGSEDRNTLRCVDVDPGSRPPVMWLQYSESDPLFSHVFHTFGQGGTHNRCLPAAILCRRLRMNDVLSIFGFQVTQHLAQYHSHPVATCNVVGVDGFHSAVRRDYCRFKELLEGRMVMLDSNRPSKCPQQEVPDGVWSGCRDHSFPRRSNRQAGRKLGLVD